MKLLVYGSQDFAQTVAALAVDCGYVIAGFVDDFNQGTGVVGTSKSIRLSHPPQNFSIVMAIGYKNLPARLVAWENLRRTGYSTPTLIHPRAYVGREVRMGEGAMVMAGAIIDVRAQIGDIAVLWPGACVNHDATIGSNSFLSPNTTICGHADIGASCFVGAGTAVVDRGVVPAGSFLPMLSRWTRRALRD